MRKMTSKITWITFVSFVVVTASFVSNPSYAEKSSIKTNFEPSKRSISFIKFMNAAENHGIRDMRSLRKRYSRYRGGRFFISDAGSSGGVLRGDKL